MIAFIDDSGDCGSRYTKGSSEYFILSLVCIPEKDTENIDLEINKLKQKMGFPDSFEFHFRNNSHKQRLVFLKFLKRKNFYVFSIILDKQTNEFKNKKDVITTSLFNLLSLVDQKKFPYKIIIDEMLGKKQINLISRNIKQKFYSLKKVQEENSTNNNLIQIADYYAGCLNRYVQGKDNEGYFQYLRNKQKKILIK